jgi:hypothetical protein
MIIAGVVSWLFARDGTREAVATRARVAGRPEQIWDRIMFYEDVPGRPAFLLRALLPAPLRTDGDKGRVGTTVRCAYTNGELAKRITASDAPHLLQFDVIEQRLGIEGCLVTRGGSYQIHGGGDASDVVLTTNYQAYLRPRSIWRPLERLLVGQLHSHILRGIGEAARRRPPHPGPAVAESSTRAGAVPEV